MTMSAWIFMLSSWAVIGGCTFYCFFRLLTSKQQLDTPQE